MTAYIGYKNLFDSATSTTASNEATGYEKENCYDWKLFDFWKPGSAGTETLKVAFASGVTADYIGVYGHNLGAEGVTLKLQYSTAGSGGPWTTVATHTPTDTEVLFSKFTGVSADDWQIELTNCTVDAKIGMIAFGEITQLPDGLRWPFTPGTYQPYESEINISQTGIPLGNTTKRKPINFKLDQSYLSPSEVRTTIIPIIQHFESTPGAFFSWDLDNYPEDVLYIYPEQKQDMPGYTHHALMKATLKLNGIRD